MASADQLYGDYKWLLELDPGWADDPTNLPTDPRAFGRAIGLAAAIEQGADPVEVRIGALGDGSVDLLWERSKDVLLLVNVPALPEACTFCYCGHEGDGRGTLADLAGLQAAFRASVGSAGREG